MANLNLINISTPDDGLGDVIRDAYDKSNANDTAINAQVEAISSALGIPALQVDMGTSAGTLLTDNATAKAWFDEVEAAISGNKVLPAGYTAAAAPIRFPQPTDTLETAISQLHAQLLTVDEGIVMRGAWDASTGAFPTAGGASDGTVKAGDLFIVDTAGVVNGVDFQVDDRLVALADGGGATYAGNWFLRDYSPDFGTALPERSVDSVGALGVTGLVPDSGHVHPLDVITELVTADTVFTLPTATGSKVQMQWALDATGPLLTVDAPDPTDTVNGATDMVLFNTPNTIVTAVDVEPNQWIVGIDTQAHDAVMPEYITVGTTVILNPATGSGVQRLFVLDASGPLLTVQPTVGEQVNGEVDGIKSYDAGNAQIVAVDVAAGQWQVSATSSFGGTSARLGEFFFAKSGKTNNGLLPVVPGTVTGGATAYPKWAAMYPEFVSGANIVFPADVEGMFLRNVGGNAGTEGAAQADGTAVNGLRTFRTYVQSDWNGQSNNDFGKGSGSGTGAVNNGVGMSSSDPETRPANRAFQLYTIVDGYGDSFAAGTLVAEPAWEIIAPGNGAWTADETVPLLGGRTWQNILDEFEEIHVSLQENDFSFYRVSANHFTEDLRIDGTQDIEIWTYSSGATGYRMWIESPNVADTSLQVSNGGHGHRDFVMRGRRKQFNAIRAEDAKLSTDFVDQPGYTGSPDAATTQGIYRHTGAPLGGAPVGNFVWTLDVDVFGDHIKQTFSPRDAGTTVLGYWVRRSFDGGGTWSAWAGR